MIFNDVIRGLFFLIQMIIQKELIFFLNLNIRHSVFGTTKVRFLITVKIENRIFVSRVTKLYFIKSLLNRDIFF
ncbi:MAG: hypothetical protein ACI9XO_004601 [Paraglaciecola sp.]|jgi:hypothetical protein